MKHASIGSVSSGTLRSEDLIPAFAAVLLSLWRANLGPGGRYHDGDPDTLCRADEIRDLADLAERAGASVVDGNLVIDDDEACALIEELTDTLTEFAPPYCAFGAHEGDGADFGFWPCRESIDELPAMNPVEDDLDAVCDKHGYGCLDRGDIARLVIGEDCRWVNDHGNVTVYGADGSVLIELV